MNETPLETVRKLLAEGKSTDEIRAILNGPSAKVAPRQPETVSASRELPPTSSPAPVEPTPVSAKTKPPAPAKIWNPPLLPGRATSLSKLSQLGWPLIVLACLVPIVRILLDMPLGTRLGSLPQALLTIGDITGIIGLVAYVINLILATRFHWLEDIFGGLNRVIFVHQVLGGAALIFLLFHPIFTAISYYPYGVRVVAHFFIPQLAYIGTAFGIVALVIIIFLLILTFYVRIGYKYWLQTHRYLGLAYVLIGFHLLLTPNRVTTDPVMVWFLYLLYFLGFAAFIYRTLLPNIFVRRYVYSIAAAQPRGIGVIEVTLSPVSRALPIKAGQFIFIAFDADGLSNEWHPFTVSSAENSGSLSIDVKSLGSYTETLTRLLPSMVGMTAHIEGAYGRFSYRNVSNANQVWIAGGIGITPFLSMAQTLGNDPYNIDLYYSVRTKSELIDLGVLAVHQSTQDAHVFRVFPFVTESYKTYLDAKIISKNTGDITKRDYLLCGPPAMMNNIKKQLLELGVKPSQIHTEEFAL